MTYGGEDINDLIICDVISGLLFYYYSGWLGHVASILTSQIVFWPGLLLAPIDTKKFFWHVLLSERRPSQTISIELKDAVEC